MSEESRLWESRSKEVYLMLRNNLGERDKE